jgi:hypothetical protein
MKIVLERWLELPRSGKGIRSSVFAGSQAGRGEDTGGATDRILKGKAMRTTSPEIGHRHDLDCGGLWLFLDPLAGQLFLSPASPFMRWVGALIPFAVTSRVKEKSAKRDQVRKK